MSVEDFDPEAEDAALLAQWEAGPGARPTKTEAARWLAMGRANAFPRITLSASAFDELKRRSEEPSQANPAMVELLRSTRGRVKHASDRGMA